MEGTSKTLLETGDENSTGPLELEASSLSSVRRLLTFDQGLIYRRCYKSL